MGINGIKKKGEINKKVFLLILGVKKGTKKVKIN